MKQFGNQATGSSPAAGALFGIFFIVIMLDGLYITNANQAFLSGIRFYSTMLLGGSVLALLLYALFFSRPTRALSFYSCAYASLILHGLFLSLLFGGADYLFADPKLIVYLLVSLGFGYAMSSHFLAGLSSGTSRVSFWLPAFFGTSLIYLMISGAILFAPLPYFNFEQFDQDVRRYSQATSALFGIASLYFILASYGKSRLSSLILTLISIFCLYLSAMGGARGDFAVALLLYVAILIRYRSIYSYAALAAVTGFIIYIFSDDSILQNFLVFERYLSTIEAGDFGDRDVLVFQSISLLADSPVCIISGCGFNYFQYFYGYEYGLYPHNFLMELAITFGFLLMLPVVVLISFGAWRLFIDERADKFFFYFSIYVLLVGLKSGSLVDFKTLPIILFLAFVPYFLRVANARDRPLPLTQYQLSAPK
jgi:hypothetical protein